MVTVAEGYWKRKVSVSEAVLLRETVVREAAKFESCGEGLFGARSPKFEHKVTIPAHYFPMTWWISLIVTVDCKDLKAIEQAVRESTCDIEWSALGLPLHLPKFGQNFWGWTLIARS